jgi:hypothetical protein
MTSAEVRAQLVRALELDLIGPQDDPDNPLAGEILPHAPSRWYVTGFLVPTNGRVADDTAAEEIDAAGSPGTDDDRPPEPRSARRVFFPSSIGLSVLLGGETTDLEATVHWGTYQKVENSDESRAQWQRTPHTTRLRVPLDDGAVLTPHPVPQSDGLVLRVAIRNITGGLLAGCGLPSGTRSVSVFLVNERASAPDVRRDEGFVFQAALELAHKTGFVPRPDLRGRRGDDWDERVAGLQYRDVCEHAVGHGVATHSTLDPDGHCRKVRTCWVPQAEIERVEAAQIVGVELSMEKLAEISTGADAQERIGPLIPAYAKWIQEQRANAPTETAHREVALKLLQHAEVARDRIAAGIACLEKPDVLDAFRTANRVMARAARQRTAQQRGITPEAAAPPRWRPFQLAFVLMNLPALDDPLHPDRDRVDLLFFPTGGGKTEAYLGLAAFVMVLRRLRNPGVASAGLSVLMRYTLRLLTLDQLGRAATLMCALELERQDDVTRLGTWPFEIGLWVGQAATPNRMGAKGERNEESARSRTLKFQNNSSRTSPIPIEDCPWCGEKLTPSSFILSPNPDYPKQLLVVCSARRCFFNRDRALPIVAVDDPLYTRVPAFVIATVDKFASLPWVGKTGALFGKLDRNDRDGFYGPCDTGTGHPLDVALRPPDLVIQDELHLISGPLGTMVGLYESALDALCSRKVGERTVRPKIVASTATVRRAQQQIRALFARPNVETFPPPGPDRRDSFFARTLSIEDSPGRLYVGVAAQGRSPKLVLLRTYLALLSAAQKLYRAAGGSRNKDNPVDPYMSLLGYFNSLRELGGTRRIVEDEVQSRLNSYGRRRRIGEEEGIFADRKIDYVPVELTSRESTGKVAEAKRRLGLVHHEKDRVDVALATNMISVGLDITRLGLMVVLGQPKSAAEYIQSTSRVGRDERRPGLVVTLLNTHRPRDRSHYERFEAFHGSFYRAVEATSVTPFSPRALDRGLAAVVTGLARLVVPELTDPLGAGRIPQFRKQAQIVAELLSDRAAAHAHVDASEVEELRKKVKGRVQDLLDEWTKIAHNKAEAGAALQYASEVAGFPNLIFEPLDPALDQQPPAARKFRTPRSLRDVEPSVNLWVKYLDDTDVEGDDE